MTDGPFKNMELGHRWKRFAEAVHNDAVDQTERIALASNNIARELCISDNIATLKDLEAYTQQGQRDLDPVSSVQAIFEKHPKSSFNDRLQKELIYRLGDGVQVEVALPDAVKASVTSHIGETKNRLQEECIRLREEKELGAEKCQSTIEESNITFDAVNIPAICDAIYEGDKKAFKAATNKKEGLDQGPRL